MTEAPPWWRSAVVYQVYIRSFADSNGDGIGDIDGLRARLPYLAELGVDAIWINPWYRSPMRDGGYDVADFRAIDPSFGTVSEAEALIGKAHELGLRVLLDLVPNHLSDQHARFQEALVAEPGTPARGWFIFRDGRGRAGAEPPNDWQSNFGGPAWTRVTDGDGRPGQWYLHLFAPEQPDLDWTNPEVRDEFAATMRFWFELGVDGFRIDVAHGLAKAEGLPDLGAIEWPPVAGEPVDTHTGTATRSTRSTARGGVWPTSTRIRACSWPRPGCTTRSGWPATSGPTSSTPRSTSTFCWRPGRPSRCAVRSRPPC